MPIALAAAMIEDHGMIARRTLDGLLAITTYVDALLDEVFDEPRLFESDSSGAIDADEIRSFLGY